MTTNFVPNGNKSTVDKFSDQLGYSIPEASIPEASIPEASIPEAFITEASTKTGYM